MFLFKNSSLFSGIFCNASRVSNDLTWRLDERIRRAHLDLKDLHLNYGIAGLMAQYHVGYSHVYGTGGINPTMSRHGVPLLFSFQNLEVLGIWLYKHTCLFPLCPFAS